jgi:hypothetical protein
MFEEMDQLIEDFYTASEEFIEKIKKEEKKEC